MTETEDELFETETMAELCARQGRPGEAMAIYRRLYDSHPRSDRRGRWAERIRALERLGARSAGEEIAPDEIPMPAAPGVRVAANDDGVTVAWALPPETLQPVLELLLIQKTATGIETRKRSVPLDRPAGRIAFAAPLLHSALAAVGRREGDRFVPLARSRA